MGLHSSAQGNIRVCSFLVEGREGKDISLRTLMCANIAGYHKVLGFCLKTFFEKWLLMCLCPRYPFQCIDV